VPKLGRDGEVFILHLDPDDENRFHPDWLATVEAALDEVEAVTGPRALVTAGSGKFWSNGLDLDWLLSNGGEAAAYLDRVQVLLARTLASPVITVATLNGHTFGAGALWALAHDVRVMRADRGFFCLPGRRYGGEQALAAGIVDAVAGADQLVAAAVDLARPLASKAKPVRAEIKETLYAETLAALRTPTAT
jgi:enoyl-CoA hydratase/carnithine racemase